MGSTPRQSWAATDPVPATYPRWTLTVVTAVVAAIITVAAIAAIIATTPQIALAATVFPTTTKTAAKFLADIFGPKI